MAEQIISKTCTKCNIEKPLTEFYADKTKAGGYQGTCKVCRRQKMREYDKTPAGQATRQHYRQSDKTHAYSKKYRRSERGKAVKKRYRQSEKGQQTHSRYVERNPDKRKAKNAVMNAIQAGHLPKACMVECACGKQAEVYHHHLGYAREHRLDVIPVCRPCHSAIHSQSA